MQIQKKKTESLEVQVEEGNFFIDFREKNLSLKVNHKNKNSQEFSFPGEYEVLGINFYMYKLQKTTVSHVDLLIINTKEGYKIAFFCNNEVTLEKDIISKWPNLDVTFFPVKEFNLEKVKSINKQIQPSNSILISFGVDEIDEASFKGEKITKIEKDKLKINNLNLDREDDNYCQYSLL